jgi:hypothetical protein
VATDWRDHRSATEDTMATKDKGLNRGGTGGQEGDLGEESKNLDRNINPQDASIAPDPGDRNRVDPRKQQQRRPNEPRGGLQREPDLEGAEKNTGHEVD